MSMRAVVFDAVGTVMYPFPSVAELYQASIADHCGLQLPTDEIRQTINSALQQRSQEDSLRTDESTEFRFWNALIFQLCAGHPGQQACFDDLYDRFQQSHHWRCFSDVAECLRQLQDSGVTTAIASNFDHRLHSVLDGLPPLSGIPHRFVSSEIGWRKPAQEFFVHVCDQLGAATEEVLFVGDDRRNDVAGAQSAGCRIAWIPRRDGAETTGLNGVRVLSSLTEVPELVRRESAL